MDNRLKLLEQNLFQCFYTFGLDSNTALSDDLYKKIKGQQKRIEFLQPKTITRFPQFRNTYASISDEVIVKHVFAKGFFVEYNSIPPIHHALFFSLDNFPFNELGRKMYYVALIFYESLYDYHSLKLDYDNFEGNNKEVTSPSEEDLLNLKNYHVPKAISLASLLPFPFEVTLMLKSLITHYSIDKTSSQVQIEKLIENLVLSIPYPPRGQYQVDFPLLGRIHTLYQTPINKVPNSSIVLQLMFAKFKVEEVIKIFKCILLELPVLFFSSDSLTLSTICEGFLSLLFPFRYQWPHVSILPVNNYSLIEICDSFFFGINEEYSKFFFEKYSIEQETKTIYAIDIDKGEVHQLKPDQTVKQNIILGQSVDPFLESMNVFEQIEMPVHYKKKFHTRLVTLAQKIKEGKEVKEKKGELEKIFYNPKIREDFFYFFVSILNDYAKYIKINAEYIYKLSIDHSISKVEVNIEKLFNVNEYISSIGGVEQMFYKRLLYTRMFKDFILKKIFPQTIEDKIEVLFFDERIIMKKNKYFFSRSVKTPLIECTKFENKSKISISQRDKFTNTELITLSKPEYRKKALTYYQKILHNPQLDTIEIKPVIFPKLLYDNEFFNKSYFDIYKSNNMPFGCNLRQLTNEEMEKIVIDKVFMEIYKDTGYYFNLIQDIKKNRQDSNKNPNATINENKDKENDYIEMSWLIIFTLSFWYCDDKEKEERVYELLGVLSKMKTIQIFNSLYQSFESVIMFVYFGIMKYGSNAQRIKLFEEFSNAHYLNHYITYATLCSSLTNDINLKVTKCNDKRPFQGMKVTLLMRESKETETSDSEEIDNTQKDSYPVRSLLKNYSETNTEFIYFSNECKCNLCLKNIEFTQEEKFKLPPQEDNAFKCPYCSKQFTPQLTVQITEDNFETVNLMTPISLFETLYTNFMTINSYQIDIDTFKQKHHDIFWNLVFYFDYKEIPFDFLIPYGKEKVTAVKAETTNYSFTELIVSSNALTYEFNHEMNVQPIVYEEKKEVQQEDQGKRKNSSEIRPSKSNIIDKVTEDSIKRSRSDEIKTKGKP